MLLANYNIQEFVTEQVKHYLSTNELTFLELKALILSKSPIPQIHSNIVTLLVESKKNNQSQVQKNLEMQAYKNQLAEDEQQIKQDHLEKVADEKSKEQLTNELNHIPTQAANYEAERALLENTLNQLLMPRIEVTHHHYGSASKKLQSAAQNTHAIAIERLRKSIIHSELKSHALHEQKGVIQKKLQAIQGHTEERLQRQLARSMRAHARVGYKQTGEEVHDTLSLKNKALLLKNIQHQHNALEKKCTDLIIETEQINFAFFLEQLPNYLTNMKLSSQEIEALNAILKFMKQHLQHELDSASTQNSLNRKKQFINSQIIKLHGLYSQLRLLQENNPHLTDTNQQLAERNTELAISYANNYDLRQRLGTPTLLLFALTCLFVIPLILTVSNVIPFFIAPALLYALVSTPPVLLMIATIAVGIASLVYRFKAKSDDSAIKMGQQTIENNTNQMSRNTQSLNTLQTTTIPALELQIKRDEELRDNLECSLKKSQLLAQQTLAQTKKIEPVLYSSSGFLSGEKTTTDVSDSSTTQSKKPTYAEVAARSLAH